MEYFITLLVRFLIVNKYFRSQIEVTEW